MGNFTSYFTPANRLARQIQHLSAVEIDDLVIAALENQPTKQVAYILRSDMTSIITHETLTRDQVILAVDDCSRQICSTWVDEVYINAVSKA
jgi:hypothetical protein